MGERKQEAAHTVLEVSTRDSQFQQAARKGEVRGIQTRGAKPQDNAGDVTNNRSKGPRRISHS